MVRGPANERNSVTKNQGTKGDRMSLINNSAAYLIKHKIQNLNKVL
ncbi:20749_t:CDS:2 [Rhizophagus irregularis]|nr:20749_t:CDS:2 [Rhizophagus irregularis]